MTYIGQFFMGIITAMLVENVLFTRALGVSPLLLVVNKSKNFFLFGGIITVITTVSSVLTWAAFQPLKRFGYRYLFEPLILVLLLGALYFAAYYFLSRAKGERAVLIKNALPYSVFNCAVVGSMLLLVHNRMSLLSSVVFGIGSGLGFLLAGFFVNEGQRRMQQADVPAAFRGLPITLLYIGILSLAFYGLTGRILAV